MKLTCNKKMDTSENIKNAKANKSCHDVRRTCKSYASKSTVHGLSYLSDDDTSGFEKCLWGFIIILGLALTTFQLVLLFDEWEDSPLITTLNTSFYPIDEIQFPQVTICPQGSVNNLVERVLFKQLTEYIKLNSFQSKRENTPWNLTQEEVMNGIQHFLEDMYPKVKDAPSKYVRLLASKNPRMTLEADAILNEGNETDCDETHDEAFVQNLNEQLNARKCPQGFELIDDHYCVYVSEQQMSFDETSTYCSDKGAQDLSVSEINHAIKATNIYEDAGVYLCVIFFHVQKAFIFVAYS